MAASETQSEKETINTLLLTQKSLKNVQQNALLLNQ